MGYFLPVETKSKINKNYFDFKSGTDTPGTTLINNAIDIANCSLEARDNIQ